MDERGKPYFNCRNSENELLELNDQKQKLLQEYNLLKINLQFAEQRFKILVDICNKRQQDLNTEKAILQEQWHSVWELRRAFCDQVEKLESTTEQRKPQNEGEQENSRTENIRELKALLSELEVVNAELKESTEKLSKAQILHEQGPVNKEKILQLQTQLELTKRNTEQLQLLCFEKKELITKQDLICNVHQPENDTKKSFRYKTPTKLNCC